MWPCQYCGHENDEGVTVCENCGASETIILAIPAITEIPKICFLMMKGYSAISRIGIGSRSSCIPSFLS